MQKQMYPTGPEINMETRYVKICYITGSLAQSIELGLISVFASKAYKCMTHLWLWYTWGMMRFMWGMWVFSNDSNLPSETAEFE